MVFTGDEFAEGGNNILSYLKKINSKASFFLTGRFYRNPAFKSLVETLKREKHYLGPHSNEHLLYCDWNNRDSLFVTKGEFVADLLRNYREMERFGILQKDATFFLPPYEWYNDSISKWTKDLGLQLVNYTPGTLSHADYTKNSDKNYRSSEEILNSIITYEKTHISGLNGFILLMHIGAGPGRTDKFYRQLPVLLEYLLKKGYRLVRVDELLKA